MEKSLSHSEQEERDGDSDSATGSPPIFQSEYLSSEPLFRGGSSTITAKASDRLHGPPSTLAKCHCRSIFATTSRAGDKPQSILQSPTAPACGLSSIDLSRTCSREGMAILGSNVAPSSSDSPSHMRMKPLHQHPTITSALLAETLPAPGQQNVVGTSSEATNRLEQNHLGSAPVQSDAVREENHAQTLSALRTELSFQEHSTIATLSLLEVAEPSSSSQPTLVVMTGTSTEPVYSSVSSIRVHLYHASEQLAGMVQGQESPVSDIEGVLITHLASNAPSSPTGAIPGLQGSVGSQISSPLPTDPVEGPPTTRMWSVSMSTSHLRTSTTITDGTIGFPTSLESFRATSSHSDPVFDHLQRAYTIPKQSLGVSVGAVAGGAVIFVLILFMHRPVYRWFCRRRTEVICIGQEPIMRRGQPIDIRTRRTQNPEVSHFSDDS